MNDMNKKWKEGMDKGKPGHECLTDDELLRAAAIAALANQETRENERAEMGEKAWNERRPADYESRYSPL